MDKGKREKMGHTHGHRFIGWHLNKELRCECEYQTMKMRSIQLPRSEPFVFVLYAWSACEWMCDNVIFSLLFSSLFSHTLEAKRSAASGRSFNSEKASERKRKKSAAQSGICATCGTVYRWQNAKCRSIVFISFTNRFN